MVMLADQLGLPYVAGQNAHYLDRADADVHDVLTCIRHRVTWDKAGPRLRNNAEWCLRSPDEMQALYVDFPQALTTADEIADRCMLDLLAMLSAHRGQAPQLHPDPPATLRRLCEQGAMARYGRTSGREINRTGNSPGNLLGDLLPKTVRHQLEHELAVIEKLGLCNYFLLAHDVCREARVRGVLYNGRGSRPTACAPTPSTSPASSRCHRV
ncbi:MAG: hypothetical protein HC853_09795 [Anaerolineae bacterium]|nr:hypothetical protein [Anaerolineae bacterium]